MSKVSIIDVLDVFRFQIFRHQTFEKFRFSFKLSFVFSEKDEFSAKRIVIFFLARKRLLFSQANFFSLKKKTIYTKKLLILTICVKKNKWPMFSTNLESFLLNSKVGILSFKISILSLKSMLNFVSIIPYVILIATQMHYLWIR